MSEAGRGAAPLRCALYLRLSKEDVSHGAEGSESIQNQRALLTSYAGERGWRVAAVYCDEDYSGADSRRPDFNRMIEAARAGAFDIILCKTQSRFTRDMELVEKYLHGLFPRWGIRFIAVADNADTEVKGNKKARQINGLVNEWYLEDLSENIRMVLDIKRRQGQYIAARPLYGYRKDPADKNRLLVDPAAAAVVRQIFQWALEGRGKQAIAHRLNDAAIPSPAEYRRGGAGGDSCGLWSKTAVWRILRNEMYTGVMVQGRRKKVSYKSKTVLDVPPAQWFRVEGTHEPIVDRDLFEAVQHILDQRTRTDGSGEVHPLAGLVRCMDCGSAMSKTTSRRQGQASVSYLRCKWYADSGREKRCTRHAIRLDRLEELVLRRVREYVAACCPLESFPLPPPPPAWNPLAEEAKRLSGQAEKLRAALRQLYLDKAAGVIGPEQFSRLNGALWEEQCRTEARLAQLTDALSNRASPLSSDRRQEKARELLRLESLPRALVLQLIDKIEIGERDSVSGKQAVRITWRFPPPEGL